MLQRAAGNAYKWWWASHIRTKQSKWLDDDLQAMEERVKSMIKLIEEDGDSFAKKAEMYYRRRPELINSVEETFKAYKALADRYDRISGELHKANHTIATMLPDQIPLMEDEDEDMPPKTISSINPTKPINMPPDSTKLPTPPPELLQAISRNNLKDTQSTLKKTHHGNAAIQEIPESVKEEIDRLQKEILILQTEKEFVKSSYQKGLAKYWDIEQQMTKMQEEVLRLQDEFGANSFIEDDEARALMASTALKSCEDALISLQEQEKISTEKAQIESERIMVARDKIKALKGDENEDDKNKETDKRSCISEEEVGSPKNERLELHAVCIKVKEYFKMCPDTLIVELAEKIDELVDKVISLDGIVSSQTAQIDRLRSEIDELHKYLRELEEERANLTCNSDSMNHSLKKAEEKLQRIQDLEKSLHEEKGILRVQFKEVCHSLNNLSEKLQSPRQTEQSHVNEGIMACNLDTEMKGEPKQEEDVDETIKEENTNIDKEVRTTEEKCENKEGEDRADCEDLLINKVEDNEKIILYKCTSLIQNFEETRKILTDIDKKNQDYHAETMQQIQELKNANATKDEEIKILRQRLFTSESWQDRSTKKPAPSSDMKTAQTIEELVVTPDLDLGASDALAKEVVKLCQVDKSNSVIEDKFRGDIDTLLDENLRFWLRFSTSYHQIQKFESTIKELQAETENIGETKNKMDGTSSLEQIMNQDTTPTEKKLRELNTEVQVWLEQNRLLQGELQCRFDSLCSIQEEISRTSRESKNDELLFTPYQAAKFQGEVINMQQENTKVAKELQTGLDHVRGIQVEVGRALSSLYKSLELSRSQPHNHPIHHFRHLSTKSRIPLRTFLFGTKPKKPSIFSCMNPTYQRQYSDLKHGGHHKRS